MRKDPSKKFVAPDGTVWTTRSDWIAYVRGN